MRIAGPPLRIDVYRRRAGLTQAELAGRLRIRRETLSRIERGRQFLTEGMEARIAFHLEIAPGERNDAFGFPIPSWQRTDEREEGDAERLVVVARDGVAIERPAGRVSR